MVNVGMFLINGKNRNKAYVGDTIKCSSLVYGGVTSEFVGVITNITVGLVELNGVTWMPISTILDFRVLNK